MSFKEDLLMKIAIACDHGALALKNSVAEHLKKAGHEVADFGTYTLDSCDYPDFAGAAARAVANGECDRGIVMCTSGIGVSIAANKVPGVRCALLHDLMSARMTREHNDTNVMALGAAVTAEPLALEIIDTWLATAFSGGERHARRIAKLAAMEK
jgi:ribose 5-phosphate isomerase B